MLADSFEGYDTAILVPPPGQWPDPTDVEARVDSYVPDAGYVSTNVFVLTEPGGRPIMSVVGLPARELVCDDSSGVEMSELRVRDIEGCGFDGPNSFIKWNEGGQLWQAESPSLGANGLVAQLATWRLLTVDDL